MPRTLFAILGLIFAAFWSAAARAPNIAVAVPVSQLPPAATGANMVYFVVDGTAADDCATGGGSVMVVCRSNGSVWVSAGFGGGSGSVPAGSILFVNSGVCPAGFSEVSALAAKTLIGTLAGNGDVGTTGGSDTLTPSGTVTSTFTGSALPAHAHELPLQLATTTTIRQIAAATFGTGTSRAATAVSAAGTANTTSAAVALSESKSAGTPAGSVSSTFSGNQTDNRSAFVKVIFCKKN